MYLLIFVFLVNNVPADLEVVRKDKIKMGRGKRKAEKEKEGKEVKRRNYDMERKNQLLEDYYKAQSNIFSSDDELAQMISTYQKDLFVSFRISATHSGIAEMVRERVEKFSQLLHGVEMDAEHTIVLAPIEWIPNHMGWTTNIGMRGIRSFNDDMSAFRKFLVRHQTIGNITRQEAVSMIPPFMMDISKDDVVLDMCAAPGSKTIQMIEMQEALRQSEGSKGYIVANDVNEKRCYVLTHQINRLGSNGVMITNYKAQYFPYFRPNHLADQEDTRLYFDRILCDVPCTGDGTFRKNYDMWETFNPNHALYLHTLQLNIAERGARLLKIGGKMVYSTCSLNPLEDEAVLATLIRRSQGSLELEDCHHLLPGLKKRRGIKHWKVFDKEHTYYDRYEDIPKEKQTSIPRTIAPPSEDEEFNLDYAMRILPFDQDTGGFFIAVLKKVKAYPSKDPKGVTVTPEKYQNFDDRPSYTAEQPYLQLSGQLTEKIEEVSEFYGLSSSFDRDHLMARGEKSPIIYSVNEGIANCLFSNQGHTLRIVNTGLRLLKRSELEGTPCPYRIAQDALDIVVPSVTKRMVDISEGDRDILFKYEYASLIHLSEALQEAVKEYCVGGMVFKIPLGGEKFTYVAGWRGKESLTVMVKKDEMEALSDLVYGAPIERSRTMRRDQ